MPKMLIEAEEAKKVLLDHYRKSNPDVTEIVIEGLITMEEVNKLLKQQQYPGEPIISIAPVVSDVTPEVINAGASTFDRPGELIDKISPPFPAPVDPEMIALVRTLQLVSDDGRVLNIRYLKGPNKDHVFELTKGLESRCDWCGYIAMSDKDLEAHKQTYHKEVVAEEKRLSQQQLDKAKAEKTRKLEEYEAEHGPRGGWGKKKV